LFFCFLAFGFGWVWFGGVGWLGWVVGGVWGRVGFLFWVWVWVWVELRRLGGLVPFVGGMGKVGYFGWDWEIRWIRWIWWIWWWIGGSVGLGWVRETENGWSTVSFPSFCWKGWRGFRLEGPVHGGIDLGVANVGTVEVKRRTRSSVLGPQRDALGTWTREKRWVFRKERKLEEKWCECENIYKLERKRERERERRSGKKSHDQFDHHQIMTLMSNSRMNHLPTNCPPRPAGRPHRAHVNVYVYNCGGSTPLHPTPLHSTVFAERLACKALWTGRRLYKTVTVTNLRRGEARQGQTGKGGEKKWGRALLPPIWIRIEPNVVSGGHFPALRLSGSPALRKRSQLDPPCE
jgi:hypothetical protein